jgi:SAM-dependent methyltransferase
VILNVDLRASPTERRKIASIGKNRLDVGIGARIRTCNYQEELSIASTIVPSTEPRNVFGTKEYWDEMYQGRGDFSSTEYSWYYGWDTIKGYVAPWVKKEDRLLIPGIGNDRLVLDLVHAKYRHITAQDYSVHAIERQQDILSYHCDYDPSSSSIITSSGGATRVILATSDVRSLPSQWTGTFDAIIEKGLLDAVYLSGDGNVERAVSSLSRVLRPGGILVSISGVLPEGLRKDIFEGFVWLRDGSNDLRAGCFVFRKGSARIDV